MGHANVKKQSEKLKACKNCYRPTHLKFNFSFISYDEGISDKHKSDLFDRMISISKIPYLELARRDKRLGYEQVDKKSLKISKKVSSNYYDSGSHRTDQSKYTIIRLYPNDNPECIRIIGHLVNKIFYIHFIDTDMKLYKH